MRPNVGQGLRLGHARGGLRHFATIRDHDFAILVHFALFIGAFCAYILGHRPDNATEETKP